MAVNKNPETIDQEGNLSYSFENWARAVGQRDIDMTPRRKWCLIAALDLDGGYAKNGDIPWHYSEDFKWFKSRTANSICVMGRKTYDDINKRLGEAAKDSVLPGRTCYVLTNTHESLPNAIVIKSLSDLNALLDPTDVREVYIIGGGQVFSEGISKADVVFITVINDTHECDAFFPTKYLLNNFGVTNIFKGQEEKLRYVAFQRIRPTQR